MLWLLVLKQDVFTAALVTGRVPLEDVFFQALLDVLLVRLQDLDEVEEVPRHVQVLINHILDLLLDYLVQLGRMQRFVLLAAEHELQRVDRHNRLSVKLIRIDRLTCGLFLVDARL